VPTTIGARVAGWVRSIRRARHRLRVAAAQLPAQLGGAGGTLASFVAIAGDPAVAEGLPAAFATELGLAAPEAPWHTERWPVTELGDALVQVADALGVFASDIATGARTEIGEWVVAAAGGSSAMPQKRNPTAAVLARSAAIRAPHLGATLHAAAALAVDERPDGAWHAEWPALRELLRLVLGAAATSRSLAAGLTVDEDAVARALAVTDGLIVAERLSIEVAPLIGADAVADIVARAADGEDLRGMLRTALPQSFDVDGVLDPARYTGLAGLLVDRALEDPS
jgi:3-carboxy-cis,cis-muconate cycloisomerase